MYYFKYCLLCLRRTVPSKRNQHYQLFFIDYSLVSGKGHECNKFFKDSAVRFDQKGTAYSREVVDLEKYENFAFLEV
jgi:hypothetical protein